MAGVWVLCGLLVGGGLWLAASGARRVERPDRRGVGVWLQGKLSTHGWTRLVAAVLVGLAVAVITRWPVAALIAGMFAYAAPVLLGSTRAEAASIAKLEAIAAWTEALRGSLRSYAGIEQAIKDTAPLAKPPIDAATAGLAAALSAGVRLPVALAAWQRDVDHHAADVVATSLRLAAAKHTGNLAGQLGWLARAVRQRVAAVQRVETARTESKTSARLVVLIVVVVGVGLYLFNRPLLEPYGSVAGQVVLVLVGGIWTLAAVWLAKLARIPEQARILRPAQEESR